jgi:hypothetical protein
MPWLGEFARHCRVDQWLRSRNMTIRSRLLRLEGVAILTADDASWLTDEEHLARYERMGREGCFAAEPEFPVALGCYQEAVQQATVQRDPPWEPWPSFLPKQAPNLRRWYWRDSSNFPDVSDARMWVMELHQRIVFGVPSVSEVEFHSLGAWFEANAERMERQALPARWFTLGSGRLASVSTIRHGLAKGYRAFGGGESAQDLRRLRALYGEGGR